MQQLKPPKIDLAIERGLAYLNGQQKTDGSFTSYSSANKRPFRRIRSWQTVFVPALMLTSLANLDDPAAKNIRQKLAKFLLKQKDSQWSFNYWSKTAPEYKKQPYPNDLDDTFCALSGLYLHNPSLIDGEALAKIVKLLVATEAAVGGPYRTWLVPAGSPPIWLDLDLAVNSNIAYFLSLATGNRLPKLDDFMEQSIANSSFKSPYYPSRYAFIYYLSRAYKGAKEKRLLQQARRLQAAAETDLDLALCICARVRLGDSRNLALSIDRLLNGQRRDGSWPAAVFYADPVKEGKLYYNGAPTLTTAFALEALELYRRQARPHENTVLKPVRSSGKPQSQPALLRLANKDTKKLSPELREPLMKLLKKVAVGSNGQEITGLATNFYDSFIAPPDLPYRDFLDKLGLANLYGWLAYTIYDDFIDDEGRPEFVSVANVAMRRSLDTFSAAAPADSEFTEFVRQIFDTVDSANAWEVANCRFEREGDKLAIGQLPDFGDLSKLAERSIGHALAPMALLAIAGKYPAAVDGRNFLKAFRHYLIARQLNDDAHDWPEDLANGHITIVVAGLLSGLKIKPGNYDARELLTLTRPHFWNSTLSDVCQLMNGHIKFSRQALKTADFLKLDNPITDLLNGLQTSVDNTLQQQSQAKDFLKHYDGAKV
jgi:hypothetical protein